MRLFQCGQPHFLESVERKAWFYYEIFQCRQSAVSVYQQIVGYSAVEFLLGHMQYTDCDNGSFDSGGISCLSENGR